MLIKRLGLGLLKAKSKKLKKIICLLRSFKHCKNYCLFNHNIYFEHAIQLLGYKNTVRIDKER